MRALADRHFGIGADQVLVVEAPSHPEADFRYRIFNADGGEVEHCGNGARCFVRFVHQHGLSRRNPLRAEISTGIITLEELDSGDVCVGMGRCRHGPDAVAFDTTGLTSEPSGADTLWQLPLPDGNHVSLSLVAISNPHAVLLVNSVETAAVQELGSFIETHTRFANRVNVGFMEVVNRHEIRLRVYERGAGETLACGTGACAAAVAGIRRGLLDSPVRVHTRGGELEIAWHDGRLNMTGSAVTVFSGSVDIDALVRQNEARTAL